MPEEREKEVYEMIIAEEVGSFERFEDSGAECGECQRRTRTRRSREGLRGSLRNLSSWRTECVNAGRE
jgi:hypothetical protein